MKRTVAVRSGALTGTLPAASRNEKTNRLSPTASSLDTGTGITDGRPEDGEASAEAGGLEAGGSGEDPPVQAAMSATSGMIRARRRNGMATGYPEAPDAAG
jgi:hypothetical protein